MTEPAGFRARLDAEGRGRRRARALAAVLVVAFLGLAVAKPWGASVTPAPGPAVGPTQGAVPPTAAPPAVTPAELLPSAFVTPEPPPPMAAWASIRWTQLAPDDPLARVRSVTRWRGGFVALGLEASGATPIWTSADGAHWQALPFNTAGTFWPGLRVLQVVEVPRGLVAVTERLADNCGGEPCFGPFTPLVTMWTSPDARTWSPQPFPPLGPPEAPGAAPLIAAGRAGLLVVSSGAPAHAATSPDGVHWTVLPDGIIRKDFWVVALASTALGYVLGGAVEPDTTNGDAATLWSADGTAWAASPALPTAAGSGATLVSTGELSVVTSFVAGRDGLIALGDWSSTPSIAVWWQSSDGRTWQVLTGYPPLGPTTCTGEGCGGQPNGALVGDGRRMVALRGGRDAGAWTSVDGRAWKRLPAAGDLPSEQATNAVLLPGGLLVSDGTTTWFGEALVR